jgi:hypothetical protein
LTPPGITLDAFSNSIRDLSNVISVMRYNDVCWLYVLDIYYLNFVNYQGSWSKK